MKHILHIFAKDARHQWLEILISLALVGTMAYTYRSHWAAGALYGNAVSFSPLGLVSSLPEMLVVIVPLSWWLVISPAIHEEKLVGDRQFWITRPYEWKKLLAAKVLFLIVFLYVPLLLAQFVMLAQAGFSPFSYIPGLLYDQLLLTCALVLPLVTLAALTRNFARMTLAVLGAAACLVAIVLLASNAPEDRVAIPYGGTIAVSLAVCVCVAVVLLQYARRKARVSWFLLGLLVVLFGAFSMGGAPDDASMNRTYPASHQASAAAHFEYRLEPDQGVEPSAFVTQRSKRVGISIPVHVSGVGEGTIVIPDYLKVTLEAPDGSRWTSVWQPIVMDKFFPGEKVANERFTMPRALYDSFKGKPLSVNVVFALTQAQAGNTSQVQLPQHDFAVPGIGICSPLTGLLARPDDIGGVACRAPLRQPELTLIRTMWSDDACATGPTTADHGIQTAAWVGSLERGAAEFGISPLWVWNITFSNQYKTENNRNGGPRKLCAGTPMTFTAFKVTWHTQSTLSITGFQLPDLDSGQQMVIDND